MTDFNQAIILGNVTRDLEVRTTPTGKSVASFSVATNRRWIDKEGQPQEQTEFHNVVAWGKLAEICGQILYKGRKVLISGRLQTRSWQGQDGTQRRTTEIVADHLSAVGAPKSAGESQISQPSAPAPQKDDAKPVDMPTEKKPADNKKDSEEINLDDIPF